MESTQQTRRGTHHGPGDRPQIDPVELLELGGAMLRHVFHELGAAQINYPCCPDCARARAEALA